MQKELLAQLNIGVDLNRDLTEQASRFAYWATKHVKARSWRKTLKVRQEEVYAKHDRALRSVHAAADKKITEAALRSEVLLTEEYMLVTQELLDAEREEDLLYVAREAFEHRKDMLITYAANARKEMDGEIRIMSEKVKRKLSSRQQED